ncbi:uncharacterized protein EHS24_005031 [Apiotrichum porosum]|uniref:Enoyl reductase (ER) domain-containing protein n=1 Tax=Apiotrichum porosum TaxID=105984 RepID=A0A427Y6P1_9TREE|nr:uncharacterized protein EHS24_005031 [Apiotrichum porosum]RSH86759.1 hypothetical protein EHS24_005031 [Apiotrichum porosum]
MKCVLVKDGQGPVENLYIGEEATPEPKAGEVQIKIQNFGLNRMDLSQREGKYPLPPQASKTILGVEFSGTVTKLGEGASKYKIGDEVFGLAFGGAYAEYICNPETMLIAKPKELSFVQAAALPENWMTAYQALFLEGGFKKGQNVLVHARGPLRLFSEGYGADSRQGASGVGVAAIQLALHVGGAGKVFTTCGTDAKVEFLKGVGGNDPRLTVINYRTQDFAEEVKKSGEGVDLIIDFVGKDYFHRNLEILNRDGAVVYLSFLSGANVDKVPLATLLYKRLTLKGSTLRSRTVEYQAKLLDSFKNDALPLIVDGKMKVEVHDVYPWTKVQDAQKDMAANKNSGKIVFEVTPVA